jgi:ribosomal protein L7/L12
MEAKQLVQALPQILRENLGWFEATRLIVSLGVV